MATSEGAPVLIDPAVSFTWPEADLSMLWCSPRPPAADRFFTVYQETAGLQDGWKQRMPLLHLRELLSVIAHDDHDWGAAGPSVRSSPPSCTAVRRPPSAVRRPRRAGSEEALPKVAG